MLDNKSAVIYGGGGSIGGAVARAFAREGAKVFLAGRTRATLEEVAESMRAAAGAAETAQVDALDEEAVDRHADAVAAEAGGIDISFNLITHPHTHGTPLAEMAVDDFMAPLETAARTTFLTARAAARHMIPRRSGVILAFGGPGDRSGPMRDYYLGGTQVAFDAIETIRRQLAVELGPHGVRVVTATRSRSTERPSTEHEPRAPGGCDDHEPRFCSRSVPSVSAAELGRLLGTSREHRQPIAAAIFSEQLPGPPAWRSLPCWYQVSEQDGMIPEELERQFAERMNATTMSLEAVNAAVPA